MVHNADYPRDAKGRFTGDNAAAEKGRAAHSNFGKDLPEGYKVNEHLPGSRLRPDAHNPTTKHIIELKPNTPSGKMKGESQLKGYIEEMLQKNGEVWTGEVRYY